MMQRLPYYMLPSYFVKLDEIPLLPNGKFARKALQPPVIQRFCPELLPKVKAEKITDEEFDSLKGTLNKPFDLFRSTAERARLFVTPTRILLYIGLSHALIDGMGFKLLLEDIRQEESAGELDLSRPQHRGKGTGRRYPDEKAASGR